MLLFIIIILYRTGTIDLYSSSIQNIIINVIDLLARGVGRVVRSTQLESRSSIDDI